MKNKNRAIYKILNTVIRCPVMATANSVMATTHIQNLIKNLCTNFPILAINSPPELSGSFFTPVIKKTELLVIRTDIYKKITKEIKV